MEMEKKKLPNIWSLEDYVKLLQIVLDWYMSL